MVLDDGLASRWSNASFASSHMKMKDICNFVEVDFHHTWRGISKAAYQGAKQRLDRVFNICRSFDVIM